MHEKTARDELTRLLRNANTERTENLQRAFANGQASRDALFKEGQAVKPYSNKHFIALIHGVGELVGLAER